MVKGLRSLLVWVYSVGGGGSVQRVERGARRTKPLGERVEEVKYFRSILLVLLAGIVLHVVFLLKVHSFRELTSANPLIAYLLISTVGLIFVAFIVIT